MTITRVGEPVEIGRDGIRITYQVPLSDVPDDDFIAAFHMATPQTSKAMPRMVTFDPYDPVCEFDSTEDDLEHWMLYFDGWLSHASRP